MKAKNFILRWPAGCLPSADQGYALTQQHFTTLLVCTAI